MERIGKKREHRDLLCYKKHRGENKVFPVLTQTCFDEINTEAYTFYGHVTLLWVVSLKNFLHQIRSSKWHNFNNDLGYFWLIKKGKDNWLKHFTFCLRGFTASDKTKCQSTKLVVLLSHVSYISVWHHLTIRTETSHLLDCRRKTQTHVFVSHKQELRL